MYTNADDIRNVARKEGASDRALLQPLVTNKRQEGFLLSPPKSRHQLAVGVSIVS